MTTLLTLLVLTKCGNILVSYRFLKEDEAYLAFNAIQMFESVILPTVSFFLCDKKRYNLRAILLAVVFFNACCFLQYFLTFFYPHYYYATIVFFIVVVIPFIYRYIIESFHPESDQYVSGGCYLAYKRPTSITGSICSLLTAPYGHCSLIVGDKEFLFKCGKVVERNAELTNKLTFKKIPSIDIAEARSLVGRKWSLKNNCFTTFGRFKRDKIF